MPDREKVIKGLENCTDIFKKCEDGCPYYNKIELPECNQLKKDALALLKEQQELIWEFQDQVEYLTDKLKEQETVVRCKDCKGSTDFTDDPKLRGWKCRWHGGFHGGDWFCADGERKPTQTNAKNNALDVR